MEELRQIRGEDVLEEPGLELGQDLSADITPDKANEMMQETGATLQSSRQEEDSFTYEVCPWNVSYFYRIFNGIVSV
jgi:hypothetical protein